ncbi:MAG: DNA polymerase III subunit alpha, partial [Chitinispirillales bacterium]|nr:DNA polymerase III subunit alpha [Chitinispirillales bacterium]
MSANFVSLHNHTEYSFLDGAIKINDLIKKAKEFEMEAVAITDHGGLFGAVEFYYACKKAKIKPILGFEAYVAPGSRTEKSQSSNERNYSHLILLAENNTGWKNLMNLSTIGYIEGFYYKPRIDMESLRRYSEGIIATSACIAGAIPRAIADGDIDKARKLTEEYLSIFGKGNFYFELQDHGIDEEKIAMEGLIKLGREMGVPFITANDAHYLRHEDAPSHEVLLCIQTQTTMDDPRRYKFSTDQVYFKSPQEMEKLFPDIPEAMTNTLEIAARCNVDISVKPQLPSVDVPPQFENPENYLSHLARKGLKEKYADVTPELEERLEFELKVINEMGFTGYFLIVRDFIQAAQERDILVGCRGSAAGSLVVYALGIAEVDPIKYDLIFERFLNPERISMPDADIDFADRDRSKVIDYVVDKYGRDKVCQIINFGTMKAKMVVKDVARAMGLSVGESNKLSAMISEDTIKKSMGITVKEVKDGKLKLKEKETPPLSTIIANDTFRDYVDGDNELANAISGSPLYQELFRHAAVLEGLTRQPGMHAAGVIIAPSEVRNWAPLFKPSNKDDIMTQFDMNYVESVGLVKMDFLGLRTLTVLQEALRLIKKYHGKEFNLWKLPEDDKKSFALLGSGETTGIFQFESGGMKEYLRKLKPTCIEDLIAMVALYRPGPMANIDMFINRKHGKEKIEYPHKMLEEILNVTYGVIIYQEQVMRIAQVMGKFSLGQADILRKAMGKKNADVMREMGEKFVEGAVSQNINKKTASEVYELMSKFAEYGFNKAHAAVYAHLSYQSAYLKAHFPLEYMTAYLGAYLGDMDEFLKMRNEAERMGIKMLPPDVNKSDSEFSIDNGSIRIGMAAVKNVGKAAALIIEAREERGKFSSIFDLCKSVDTRIVNKKALESLVYAGALDGFGPSRSRHEAAVAAAIDYANSFQKERASGQVNLFDVFNEDDKSSAAAAPEPVVPEVSPWPLNVMLQKEKEMFGFYASGHPLEQFTDEINGFSTVNIGSETFKEMKNGAEVTIGGMITSIKKITTKNGKEMGFFTLETFEGTVELIAFSEIYEKFKELLTAEAMILIHGKLNRDDRGVKINLDNCIALNEAREKLSRSVHLRISTNRLDENFID